MGKFHEIASRSNTSHLVSWLTDRLCGHFIHESNSQRTNQTYVCGAIRTNYVRRESVRQSMPSI